MPASTSPARSTSSWTARSHLRGWLLPFNAPLTLLTEDAAGRHEAIAQLIRIGYEQTRGYLEGGMAAWTAAGLPTNATSASASMSCIAALTSSEAPAVLDVRDETEWRAGHIPGAQHIHVADLPRHLHETPMDRPVAIICRSGYRASIAASMLAALGRPTIAVQGGVGDWIAAGYPTRFGANDEGAPELEHSHP